MLFKAVFLKSGILLKNIYIRSVSQLPIKVLNPNNLTDLEKRFLNAAEKVKTAQVPPERDLINFPHVLREIYPGKVRMGIFPEEWFDFFYKRTGVTGPYIFGASLSTFLISKEIYVLDHESVVGLCLIIIIFGTMKLYGDKIKNFLLNECIKDMDKFENDKQMFMEELKSSIETQKLEQWRAASQKMLIEAKRENVDLQLEATYRSNLLNIYNEVKRRLDYHVEISQVKKQFEHKYLVSWVLNEVKKAITPEREQQILHICIADLRQMAAEYSKVYSST